MTDDAAQSPPPDQAPPAAPQAPAADAPADRPEKQVTAKPNNASPEAVPQPLEQSRPTVPGIETDSATGKTVTALYLALIAELEVRRHTIGISQEEVNELCGDAERSFTKSVHPTTASGRTATWKKLERYCQVLFNNGYEVRLIATNSGCLTTEGTRKKIRSSAVHFDRRSFREYMRELSKAAAEGRKKIPWRKRVVFARLANKQREQSLSKEQRCQLAHRGGLARMRGMTPEERAQFAKRASLARWTRRDGEG